MDKKSMQDTVMNQREKIDALNATLQQDSGRFVTIKGIGHRLVGMVTDPDLSGYWFGYRCGALFHVPVSKHGICLLSAGEKGATNVHGKLSKSDFLQIFGKDKLNELDKAFSKSVLSILAFYVIIFGILGLLGFYLFDM
jgi:hypothetical protein